MISRSDVDRMVNILLQNEWDGTNKADLIRIIKIKLSADQMKRIEKRYKYIKSQQ